MMSSSKKKAASGRESGTESTIGRRNFMGVALGAAAGAGAAAVMPAAAQNTVPGPQRPTPSPPMSAPPAGSGLDMGVRPGGPRLFRVEADVKDVEVDGKIPDDLNGAFYRTGPDAQYPLNPRNIPFDGEGHVSMFRIKDGRVDYKSRFARNERYLARKKRIASCSRCTGTSTPTTRA